MLTHLLPIYQKKIAYGKSGFPWTSSICRREIDYSKGICPIAEDIHENKILQLGLCSYDYSDSEIDLVIKVFHKVWNQLEDL